MVSISVKSKNEVISGLIEKYKKHIQSNGLKGEIYKWELAFANVINKEGKLNMEIGKEIFAKLS